MFRYLGRMSPELAARRQERLQNLYRSLMNWDGKLWDVSTGVAIGLTGAGMLLAAIGKAAEWDMIGTLGYATGLYGTAIFPARIMERVDNYMSSQQNVQPHLEVLK